MARYEGKEKPPIYSGSREKQRVGAPSQARRFSVTPVTNHGPGTSTMESSSQGAPSASQ